MRVLVTGANGFIGSHVCHRLVQDGHQVIRVLRKHEDSGERHDQGIALYIDLRRSRALEQAIQYQPDILIHLAAVIPPSFMGSAAEEAGQVNRIIDENLFLACEALNIGAVYASSTSVYGFGDGKLKCETSSTNPIGPYAEGKLAGEARGTQVIAAHGLPFTVLRINAPYGPGQRAHTVLKLFIENALKGLPVMYHGTGSRQQDFIYADDVSDAVVKAAVMGKSGIFNISGGHPVSMKELAKLVVKLVPGSTSCICSSGKSDPQEGVTALYGIDKALRELHWKPQVSLEAGIKAWLQSFPGMDS